MQQVVIKDIPIDLPQVIFIAIKIIRD